MPLLRERLERYLESKNIDSTIEAITPDASTRRYFRFIENGRTCVACVYPDDIKHSAHSYVDVTSLFLKNDLPVAEIFDFDEVNGIVVVEDLGDRILREELASFDANLRASRQREALKIIARIQAATSSAVESNSIAGRLRFDAEKLLWELNYFRIHYFTTYKKEPLAHDIDSRIESEFLELSRALEAYASVLCHRDFHAANLMIDPKDNLRIIDHQDARIGSLTYDLVSLLLDRVTELPSAGWLDAMKSGFLEERERFGMAVVDRREFDSEFDLQTVQRCLKAVGTFSFQATVREKHYFIPFIAPMFRIVHSALGRLKKFPAIRSVLEAELRTD